jgi:hypothetical protein
VGGDTAGLSEFFGRIEERGTWDCGYCLPSRNHRKIFIARDPLLPIDEIWSRIRHYQ